MVSTCFEHRGRELAEQQILIDNLPPPPGYTHLASTISTVQALMLDCLARWQFLNALLGYVHKILASFCKFRECLVMSLSSMIYSKLHTVNISRA